MVDLDKGSLVDPRLGRMTVGEWRARSWPTVTNLRPSTRLRYEASSRNHIEPAFGSMPVERLPLPRSEREEMRFLTANELRRLSAPSGYRR